MKIRKQIILFFIVGLLSVKFYIIYRSHLQNAYSMESAYNGADAGHYLTIAKNIAEFKVYSDSQSSIPSEGATWRPPFWPFILSILFHFSSNPLSLILLKSIVESTLILWILFQLKKQLEFKLIWFAPFFLLLIEPSYLKYATTFLSESLTSILILLLVCFFVNLDNNKRYHLAIPLLSASIILCHPVSVFFVLSLFIIYLCHNLRTNFLVIILHGILFSVLVLAWPTRNYITFQKGFYITASQGATFSKGWNEKVSTDFTNVEGDAADETLNLKYLKNPVLNSNNLTTLDWSNLYTEGTKNYIASIPLQEKLKIVFIKLQSNFNPFPEKAKPVFLDKLSILFRILYLFTFFQLIFRCIKKPKMDFNSRKDKVFLVVLSVFMGQIIMSIYVYTGLRFNAIYSLTLLFCFIYLNIDFFIDKVLKLKTALRLK
jgi:hypothetical protein